MSMKQRVINSLTGAHLGDEKGVPMEGWLRPEILARYGPNGYRGQLIDFDPAWHKVPDTRGLAPGSTSDDSQLLNASADGLILAGEYDHELQIFMHLRELQRDVAGWGGTTKLSLCARDQYYRQLCRTLSVPQRFRVVGEEPEWQRKKRERDRALWEAAIPCPPSHPAPWGPYSRGNGVAMKIAALALFLGLRGRFDDGTAFEDIFQFGQITHADPVCSIAALAVGSIVADLLRYDAEEAFHRLMPRLLANESLCRYMHRGPERFTHALKQALALSGDPEALWAFGSEDRSDSMTTVPLALAIWYRHANDREPTEAIYEAINAGGDTDTVAAMVGAMMGAMSDRADWWPKDWTSELRDGGALARKLGADLHDVAIGSKRPEGWDREEMLRTLRYK